MTTPSTSLLSMSSSDELFSLENILESKDRYYHSFIMYLHHTYCIENIYFWQDVQKYKSNPTLEIYQAIIERYITVNAPYEINIPCHMRQNLLTSRNRNHTCFDEAAETILELVRTNSFLPWYCQQKTERSCTLSPSLSVPNYCSDRLSFSSFRSVTSMGSFCSHLFVSEKRNKLSRLFERKKQAWIIKMKRVIT
ncbi:RGS domain-containing protein [Cokeromyces recurvatus]|uniref:RGS domain-containing protein n=1 Tax=Cokeromyces recurvatus TaxID=90255 RepID=UPI00221EC530|nr:RGS domain-containing protein [Cokeromyces recurvatus]KAI7898981.1 RGS domain-containing protein [Cokeromyces recurvatus]